MPRKNKRKHGRGTYIPKKRDVSNSWANRLLKDLNEQKKRNDLYSAFSLKAFIAEGHFYFIL